MEPELDRPFDKGFKSLAEDEALMVLNKFARIPSEAIAGIEHLPREITERAPEVDHAYRIRLDGRPMVVHLEAWSQWRSLIPDRALEYGGMLHRKYGIEVRSVIVLLRPEEAPVAIPESAVRVCGNYREEYRFEVIRLWEMPAEEAMDPACERLLAWVPFMRHSESELRECARRVVERGDEKLSAEFVINGGVRYDRNWLRQLLEGFKPMITMDVYRDSSVTRERYLQAVSLGRTEGEAVGAAKAIRAFLAARFPDLTAPSGLDKIADAAELSTISRRLFAANTSEDARAVLDSIGE